MLGVPVVPFHPSAGLGSALEMRRAGLRCSSWRGGIRPFPGKLHVSDAWFSGLFDVVQSTDARQPPAVQAVSELVGEGTSWSRVFYGAGLVYIDCFTG
jgi:hypothetical protein